jgi:hypothetical protein
MAQVAEHLPNKHEALRCREKEREYKNMKE